MARLTKPLTDKEIKAAKPKEREYKLFDGGGLYLTVTPKNQKWWRLKLALSTLRVEKQNKYYSQL